MVLAAVTSPHPDTYQPQLNFFVLSFHALSLLRAPPPFTGVLYPHPSFHLWAGSCLLLSLVSLAPHLNSPFLGLNSSYVYCLYSLSGT